MLVFLCACYRFSVTMLACQFIFNNLTRRPQWTCMFPCVLCCSFSRMTLARLYMIKFTTRLRGIKYLENSSVGNYLNVMMIFDIFLKHPLQKFHDNLIIIIHSSPSPSLSVCCSFSLSSLSLALSLSLSLSVVTKYI